MKRMPSRNTERTYARKGGIDIAIEAILIATLVLSPLALGSVAPWARSLLMFVGLLLFNLWLLRSVLAGEISIMKSPAWILVALFIVLAFIQVIPFPPGVLRILSPAAWHSYSEALGERFPAGSVRTLSLNPYYTLREIMRLAAVGMVFFMVLNSARARWQVKGLAFALMAVGSFEALYGLAEQFSGHKHIFWLARQHHLEAVTGTFHNKNHFAGLLEMVIPVTLGCLVALDRSRARDSSARASGLGKQITLAALTIIMIVAVFFSLSRTGIVCVIASIAALLLIAAAQAHFRGYAFAVIAIGAAVATIAVAIGIDYVIAAVGDVAGGQSASWIERLILARGALALIRDYPLFGTGLGTFAGTFGGYQSPHFADAWVNFLHNDWLQIFCEMGLLGGAIVVAGTLWVVHRLFKSIRRQDDTFLRWMATGALLGVLSMLFHSFLDYNLSRITSNGIAFAATLGIGIVAANMEAGQERFIGGFWRLRLGQLPVRMAVVSIGLGASVCALPALLKSAAADISFNRYLAETTGKTEDYFFLPVCTDASDEDGDSGVKHLLKALENQPRNPEYLYHCALYSLRCAEEFLRCESKRRAVALLGPASKKGEPELEHVATALANNLRPLTIAERSPHLVTALDFMNKAIETAPTEARYHIACAKILAELNGYTQARREVETALLFAPASPDVLLESARILVTGDDESSDSNTEAVSLAQSYLRATMYANPSYAERVYSLARSMDERQALLFSITPPSLKAYEALYLTCWKSGQWDAALDCLDALDHMADRRQALGVHVALADIEKMAHVAASGEPIKGAAAYDPRTPLHIKASIAQRRGVIFGILGRWDERSGAAASYRTCMREGDEKLRLEAERLQRLGRYREAAATYLDILERDWSDPGALLELAELASLPGMADSMPQWNGPLDLLYRLVINATELSPDTYEQALRLLDGHSLRGPYDTVTGAFIRGAGAILAGRPEEGISTLETLATNNEEAATWRQKHLIWFYLGLGLEQTERITEARIAYMRALEIVPAHRPSLLRLVGLTPSDSDHYRERLASLTPEVLCEVNFGGKLVFLGYSLSKRKHPINVGGLAIEREDWFITYYWQFTDRMYPGYHPAVHFCDEQWNILFQDDHRIVAEGNPYPADFARNGEVVVERRLLRGDPEAATYLRVAVRTDSPPRYLEKNLVHDLGQAGPVQLALEFRPESHAGEILAQQMIR
jgi:O-antigen ligase/tetratricopeptide (TPR) repeat protein